MGASFHPLKPRDLHVHATIMATCMQAWGSLSSHGMVTCRIQPAVSQHAATCHVFVSSLSAETPMHFFAFEAHALHTASHPPAKFTWHGHAAPQTQLHNAQHAQTHGLLMPDPCTPPSCVCTHITWLMHGSHAPHDSHPPHD